MICHSKTNDMTMNRQQEIFKRICESMSTTPEQYMSYEGQKRVPDNISFVTQAVSLVLFNSQLMNFSDIAKLLHKTPQTISIAYNKCMQFITEDHPVSNIFVEAVATSCKEGQQTINKLTKSNYHIYE